MHCVDLHDVLGTPWTFGERFLERAVVIVEVVVAPSRFLRPPDHVAAAFGVAHRLRFERGVLDGLGEQRPGCRGVQVDFHEIQIPLRAIATHHANLVRTGGPMRVHQPLVLPLFHVHLRKALACALEYVQFLLPNVRLARHGVRVRHERGTRVGERVHEVEFLHLALVDASDGERLGIGRPDHIWTHARIPRATLLPALRVVQLLRIIDHLRRVTEAEAVIFHAVGGDLHTVRLADVHDVQVMVASEYERGAVRRVVSEIVDLRAKASRAPATPATATCTSALALFIGQHGVSRNFAKAGERLCRHRPLVAGGVHGEVKRLVVAREGQRREGQGRGVIGLANRVGQRRRELCMVKQRSLAPGRRHHEIKVRAHAVLPVVPHGIGLAQPSGLYRCPKNNGAERRRTEAISECPVGTPVA